jgi:hypothetical protein
MALRFGNNGFENIAFDLSFESNGYMGRERYPLIVRGRKMLNALRCCVMWNCNDTPKCVLDRRGSPVDEKAWHCLFADCRFLIHGESSLFKAESGRADI